VSDQKNKAAISPPVNTPTAGSPQPVVEEPVLQEIELPALSPTGEQTPQEAEDYAVPWKSINGGGGTAQAGDYRVSLSIGQAAIGYVTGTNYHAGIGFWYGVGAGAGACDCGSPWGDVDGEGTINAADVVVMVNYVYKAIDIRIPLPNCPMAAGDVDCVDNVNAADVVLYINYVYKNITPFPCPDPCVP
jgi:hypothetical protein